MYKKEIFDFITLEDGDTTILLPDISISDKTNIEYFGTEWTYNIPHPLGTQFAAWASRSWGRSLLKQPNLTKGQIHKHFREVRPGEIDFINPGLRNSWPGATNPLFLENSVHVMYLGTTRKMVDNPGFDTSVWNMEMTFLDFLVGDKLHSICDHHFVVSSVLTKIFSGAGLFAGWAYHKEKLYCSKNRKIK